jgi:chaperonin GroES
MHSNLKLRSLKMDFKVKPLYDQVFVKKDDASMTKSGLHLTQTVKGRAVVGTVVAVGPGLLSPYTGGYLPMSVKPGDRVFLREFMGSVIKYDGQEVHCMKENEIVGIVVDPEVETKEL